jgi:ABC-type amino acid transport substrate-binding protein
VECGKPQEGAEAVTPVYTKDDAAQTLALQSGRADAFFGPNVIGVEGGADRENQTGGQRGRRLAESGAHRGDAEKRQRAG